MKKFLVISYDSDQQQWFYDFLMAADADQAKASILELRSYCQDADAIGVSLLGEMSRNLARLTPAQIEKEFRSLLEEHRRENVGGD
jgi:hypothetical protein